MEVLGYFLPQFVDVHLFVVAQHPPGKAVWAPQNLHDVYRRVNWRLHRAQLHTALYPGPANLSAFLVIGRNSPLGCRYFSPGIEKADFFLLFVFYYSHAELDAFIANSFEVAPACNHYFNVFRLFPQKLADDIFFRVVFRAHSFSHSLCKNEMIRICLPLVRGIWQHSKLPKFPQVNIPKAFHHPLTIPTKRPYCPSSWRA